VGAPTAGHPTRTLTRTVIRVIDGVVSRDLIAHMLEPPAKLRRGGAIRASHDESQGGGRAQEVREDE